MPRLLRVHFASIGHPDARLAPVTLNMCGGANEEGRPAGDDTVIWLRNGGGKSSMLNLLFSVFLPNMREFLGTTAEGKRQRFDDYVQASDLGFVVTQWDLSETDTRPLFPDLELPSRVVGRMVAWPNQHKSADPSNLKHLYFSFKTSPDVQFESIPVQGLGKPIPSFEDFRRWLYELREAMPKLDVYYTHVQHEWYEHLTSIHLDPEMFRYLVQMNRNEGDAESLFRHKTARDFVRFFLDMTLDPSQAGRVVSNLEELKKQLRGRPQRLLESKFLQAVLTQFEPFAAEVASYREALSQLHRLGLDGAALVAGLDCAASSFEEKAKLEDGRAKNAAQKQTEHEQSESRARRQAAWLRHRAAQLDLDDAKAELDQAKQRQSEAKTRERVVEAAKRLQRVRELEARRRGLIEAQQKSDEGRAPLRQATELAGARLVRMLNGEIASAQEQLANAEMRLVKAKEAKEEWQVGNGALQAEAGQLKERAGHLENQIERRDRAMEKLVNEGIIKQDELAGDASMRWTSMTDELGSQLVLVKEEEEQHGHAIDTFEDQLTSLNEGRNKAEQERNQREKEFHEAVQRRDRLSTHPRIVEIEEVERADLESPGLLARLNDSSQAVDSQLFRLRMNGVENERALQSLQQTQLLPPSRDVEIVVGELQRRKVPAHSFQAYLAEHATTEDAERLLAGNPGRFTGVGVPTANWLAKVGELDNRLPGLQGPVQVSLLTLEDEGVTTDSVVLTPEERGTYSYAAAQSAHYRLESEELGRAERQERLNSQLAEIGDVKHDLTDYLAQYGSGKLGELETSLDASRQQAVELCEQMKATKRELFQAKERRDGLVARIAELQRNEQTVRSNCQQIETLVAEHENELPRIRRELKHTRTRQEKLATEQQHAFDQLAASEQEISGLQEEIHRLKSTIQSIEKETGGVHFCAVEATTVGELSLEETRAEYAELERKLDRELSHDRTQGQLDQLEPDLAKASEEYATAGKGLKVSDIEACCDSGPLDFMLAKAKEALFHLTEEYGRAEASFEQAKKSFRQLEALDEQRERPPNAENVNDAAEARQLADRYDAQRAEFEQKKGEAGDLRREHEANAGELRTRSKERRHHEKMLRVLIKNVADAESAPLPDDDAELQPIIEDFCQQYTAAEEKEEELGRNVRGRLTKIRLIADDQKFASHQDQIKIRLRSDESVLMDQAGQTLKRLQERLHVTAELLKSLDKHRATVLSAVHELAMDAKRLLESIEKVSVMPEGFDAWTGQPFLRVRLPAIGKTPDERLARLEPLVDRIIEDADLPDGVRLATQAAEALLGGRDFEVTLLKPKPQGTRQTTRHPIANLASFSEGEKLTVAVLLFCTLVRLRARNRPTGHDGAKVLVLDNPFGKCNYPEFIKQQLAIANQLNIQLVYTTGVDDPGALSYFPNRIKLKNTTRNRLSGFSHVTHDEEGVVTSIRVARRGAADGST